MNYQPNHGHVRCHALNYLGQPCKKKALSGMMVCYYHQKQEAEIQERLDREAAQALLELHLPERTHPAPTRGSLRLRSSS